MVPRSTIHKQKKEFFALVSVSLCLPLPTPTFPRMTLKCSRSSAGRCNNSMRRSRGPSFNYKRQCKPIVQSVWLRKPGEKWRPKPRKKQRGRELWRRRRERRGQWNISSDSRTRCQRKRLKDPKLQGPSARRSLLEMRKGNSPSRRLEESTAEVPQSRWRVLTPVRGVCAPGRIAWYIPQGEYLIIYTYYYYLIIFFFIATSLLVPGTLHSSSGVYSIPIPTPWP